MASPPTQSPVTGNPVPEHYVHASSLHFQDTKGRNLLLRGVNLSGGAKAPHNQPSHSQEGFWSEAEAGRGDFVGRPLNLEDGSADEHLARLRAWGYNMLRYVFTWEALEHEGPGKYDVEYMDYVVKVLYKCKEWGFRVFMDPHQDVWSRFSGGSGAPLWTLYACGIDPQAMNATRAALVHCDYPTPADPHPAQFPGMIWGTNYTKTVVETVFTLFFGGKAFAPKCVIDGQNIQDWLQGHFIGAVAALAKRISDAGGLYDECVIGWDSMNEPGEGMIGQKDIGIVPADRQLKKGPTTSPIQGMRLAMGQKQEVVIWDFGALGPKKNGTQVIDPRGRKLWLSAEDEKTRGGGKWGWKRGDEWEMGTCIWAQHGIWDIVTGDLLRPDYFNVYTPDPSRQLSFVEDFFKEHWVAYATRIRSLHPEAIHFIQAPVMKPPPHIPESLLKGRACSSPHYYDGLTLMTKHWNWFNADALGMLRGKYWSVVQAIRIGESAIRNCIQGQLGIMRQDTEEVLGQYPTLIGEIGCPYDMDDKRAYGFVDGGRGEGDYSAQQKAWDCSMNALEGPNALNYTLWTYVPDNSHEWGDLWNGEDLSIWSKDDTELPDIASATSAGDVPEHDRSNLSIATSTTVTSDTPNYTPASVQSGSGVTADLITNGARTVGAVCRPFPVATVGEVKQADFDLATSTFKLAITVRADDPSSSSTELYIPFVHYAKSLSAQKDQEHYTDSTSKPTVAKQEQAGLELDIDVRLTHGSFTIKGQYLTWTYPLPSPAQRQATYTIEIKRRGGPIRRVQESAYAQAAGTWSDVCGGCTIA